MPPQNLKYMKQLSHILDPPSPLFPRDILREVKESKGRFLVKDPKTEEWKEVSDEVAREKVAQVRIIGHKVSLVLARHI